jgi:hypothetical protein
MNYQYDPHQGTLFIPRPKAIAAKYWKSRFTTTPNKTCWDGLREFIDHLRAAQLILCGKIKLREALGESPQQYRELLAARYDLETAIALLTDLVYIYRPKPETPLAVRVHELQAQLNRQQADIKAIKAQQEHQANRLSSIEKTSDTAAFSEPIPVRAVASPPPIPADALVRQAQLLSSDRTTLMIDDDEVRRVRHSMARQYPM